MKTVKEIIEELQELVEHNKEIGSLPVYVIADHGQTFIQSGCISVEHTLGDYEYYEETYHLE